MFFHTLSSKKAHERITALEEQLEKLRRDFKLLELDWENAYDKLKTMMQRTAKRAEAMHERAEAEGSLVPLSIARAEPNQTHGGSMLTDNQKLIQQRILRRRAGG